MPVPGRIFLGVGTGEALNEIATGYIGEWPEFKERFARLRESVRLMRELWTGERVDFEGEYYRTQGAAIYDVPEGGIPVYIAAGGAVVAKYAGRRETDSSVPRARARSCTPASSSPPSVKAPRWPSAASTTSTG
ncbi:F420-dependent glucose-6-phosphate dehydrogenase [Mycobacteroides abscessus]|nr:F420-dependent glucose-6-phosphate dehydrogenase [Mycobacteroides abscessus]